MKEKKIEKIFYPSSSGKRAARIVQTVNLRVKVNGFKNLWYFSANYYY